MEIAGKSPVTRPYLETQELIVGRKVTIVFQLNTLWIAINLQLKF